jgi:hypothetical protein
LPQARCRRIGHLVQAATEAVAAAVSKPDLMPVPSRHVNLGLEFYRKYTEAMLRRYTKLSMEAGRVPSMLGQEMFRGRVTSYKVHGFDDVVIFVHDLGQCLKGMSPAQQHLLRRIACEQYTQGETAAMLGISLRTVIRRYNEALDQLTQVLLERKMLEPLTQMV